MSSNRISLRLGETSCVFKDAVAENDSGRNELAARMVVLSKVNGLAS
jgi:hypothetical protein